MAGFPSDQDNPAGALSVYAVTAPRGGAAFVNIAANGLFVVTGGSSAADITILFA